MPDPLLAGASQIDVSPRDSRLLFGYPHVERMSTGLHDPLWSSSLYFAGREGGGRRGLLFVGNDVIYVSKETTGRVRRRISTKTGVPSSNIMVSATHTHSGPSTVDWASAMGDVSAARMDPRYLEHLEDGMVESAVQACARAVPAEAGLAVANATGLGTNRRNPRGPSDPELPVLSVREVSTKRPIAVMLICTMHPTVLHEDSRLVSGDFPGMARIALQRDLLGEGTPVVCHTGPCGNQSPRHVVQANTFEEAERLGQLLSASAAEATERIEYRRSFALSSITSCFELPRRKYPSVCEAEQRLLSARERFADLKRRGAARPEVRTAECDLFGAEETLILSRSAMDGRLDPYYASCLPAEIQILRIGSWNFVGWPGEISVEYGLAVKKRFGGTYVISMANGELQGYIVTEEADREGGYEASNSLFGPAAGKLMVQNTIEMLLSLRNGAAR